MMRASTTQHYVSNATILKRSTDTTAGLTFTHHGSLSHIVFVRDWWKLVSGKANLNGGC